MKLLNYLREHQLAGGIVVLAVTQFGASIVGLVRDHILNQTFAGNLAVVDAYLAAFRPSDLIFQTCIVSAMGTVLVPVLASYHARGDNTEMSKVLNGSTGIAAAIFGLVALILGLLFPWIGPHLVEFQGETLPLYIRFGQLTLLINFLFVFGNATGQYLITMQKYWIYGITPIVYTLGTIAGTIWLTPYFGVFGPIYGTLLGACLYVLLRQWAVLRSGASFAVSLWHADIPSMARLMLPRILASGAFQMQLLFLDRLASGFPAGAVTINSSTRNFQSVLVGVVGIAIAQSVYSILSQAAAKKQEDRFHKYFRHGMWLCILLTIPGAIALVLLSPFAAHLVSLSQYLRVFTICIAIYAVSIPFESISHLQYRAFYAMKETMIPACFGVLGGAAAVATGFFFAPSFGFYSIPLGYTLGEAIQTMGLALVLPSMTKRFMKPLEQTSSL